MGVLLCFDRAYPLPPAARRIKEGGGECLSRAALHMDCMHWVNRDSYLPQGSRGLKAVTRAKLGYNPMEVPPEDMVRMAAERPQTMASYSVSDAGEGRWAWLAWVWAGEETGMEGPMYASVGVRCLAGIGDTPNTVADSLALAVATYYLYMKYIHPFIFSLCTIIPMAPDEVLRKGSGTLCEMLLMVEAYRAGVVAPNKHVTPHERYFDNRLLEAETYIGGKVEAIESGIFRADIPLRFRCSPAVRGTGGVVTAVVAAHVLAALSQANKPHLTPPPFLTVTRPVPLSRPQGYQELIDNLDEDMQYAVQHEGKASVEDVVGLEDVKARIRASLEDLRDRPNRDECPVLYHLDVSAMYPNIILTNRLQARAGQSGVALVIA